MCFTAFWINMGRMQIKNYLISIQVAFKYVKKGYDKNRFVLTALWMNVDMGRMRINQILNDTCFYTESIIL